MKEEDKIKAASDLTQAVLGAVDGGLVPLDIGLREMRESARMTGVWSNITDEWIEEASEMPNPAEQAEQQQELMEAAAAGAGAPGAGGEEGEGEKANGLPGATVAAKAPPGLRLVGGAKGKGGDSKGIDPNSPDYDPAAHEQYLKGLFETWLKDREAAAHTAT